MPFPFDVKEMWNKAFRSSGSDTKIAVTLEGDAGLLEGISYDDIQANFVSSTVTIYSYYLNGSLQAQVEVTFTNTSKSDVSRARRI